MTTYVVTYTNGNNEETEITVYGASSQKDAWNKAEESKKKYLSAKEKVQLGLVTKIEEI